MREPVKIAIAVVAAVAALCLAYLGGTYVGERESATELTRLKRELGFDGSLDAVDYDRLLACITAIRDEEAAFADFEGAVDTLHRALLNYMAERLGLTSEERASMMDQYAVSSGSILINYQQMMGQQVDSIETPLQPILSYDAYNSVNDFVGIFSGHACGLLSFPGRAQLKQASGLVGGGGDALDVRLTCQNVLTDAIAPLAKTLREKAVIQDLNTSELKIESQVRSMVAELATAEERLTADFTDFYQTRFLFMKSEALLRARADATVKVGFDLNKRFSIEMHHDTRRMTIRLPEPEVLSNEVNVEFVDVKNGTLVKIDREKYNAALTHAREMMSEQVVGSAIFAAAKRNARRIIQTVFQPMMSLPEFRYEVDVVFPRGAAPVTVVEATG